MTFSKSQSEYITIFTTKTRDNIFAACNSCVYRLKIRLFLSIVTIFPANDIKKEFL